MFAAAVDVVVIIFNIALNYCLFFSSFLSISIPFVGGRRRRCCVFCDELSVRVHNSWHRKKNVWTHQNLPGIRSKKNILDMSIRIQERNGIEWKEHKMKRVDYKRHAILFSIWFDCSTIIYTFSSCRFNFILIVLAIKKVLMKPFLSARV